jgi:geranylgeranyl diphosphate synthase type 3
MKMMLMIFINIVYRWIFFFKYPDLTKHKMCVLTESKSLYQLGIQLMQLFSENKTDFNKLIDIFGLYIQIQNDYRNLFRIEVTPELLVVDI